MKLTDELQQLQEMHERGALTAEEFAQAKARVLSGETSASADTPALQRHFQQVEWQNELERLDREWELERESYVQVGKYGSRHLPQRETSLLAALVGGGFGLFWTFSAMSMGAPAFFPLFGVIFIVAVVGAGLSGYQKAEEYEAAYARYQKRRAKLLNQQER